jgi:hypothetical protein
MGDWLDAGQLGPAIDVPALLDSEAGRLIYEVAGYGALVGIGLTGDGGALGITVTVDGRYRREYFRNSEDLADWLGGGLDDIRAAVELARTARASAAPRKRLRGV